MPNDQNKEIVTFYSFKGGTGRTMALANIALLTARLGKNVLVIDWDLEAPGLHRYFTNYIEGTEEQLNQKPGLIDFFIRMDQKLAKLEDGLVIKNAQILELLRKTGIHDYLLETSLRGITLLKAGAFTNDYPEKISRFNWESFFKLAPGFFACFCTYLKEYFDFVYIDSRTGFTDTSGICTTLMPEKLCLVFTPNKQSLDGVKIMGEKALSYRMNSTDFRPLKIYPIPSRVELAEKDLRKFWRKGYNSVITKDAIDGFQPVFEDLFNRYYGLEHCDLTNYFDIVQIHHEPKYAYGEKLAVLNETFTDRLSLTKVYSELLQKLLFDSRIYSELQLQASDSTPKLRIYLSSGSADLWLVQQIRVMLEDKGKYYVTLATEQNADISENYLKFIEERILASQIFIPVISPEYLGSQFGSFELLSYSRNITSSDINLLIPIYFDENQNLRMSSRLLSQIQGINYNRHTQNIQSLVEQIEMAIEKNKSLYDVEVEQDVQLKDGNARQIVGRGPVVEVSAVSPVIKDRPVTIKKRMNNWFKGLFPFRSLGRPGTVPYLLLLPIMLIGLGIQLFEIYKTKKAADIRVAFNALVGRYSTAATESRGDIACSIAAFYNGYNDKEIDSVKVIYTEICKASIDNAQKKKFINNTDTSEVYVKTLLTQLNIYDKQAAFLKEESKTTTVEVQPNVLKEVAAINDSARKLISSYPQLKSLVQSADTIRRNIIIIDSVNNVLNGGNKLNDVKKTGILWFKQGYYLQFDQIRVLLERINKDIGIQVNVYKVDNKYLIKEMGWISYDKPLKLPLDSSIYTISLIDIGHAGYNPFNLAAYITITKEAL